MTVSDFINKINKNEICINTASGVVIKDSVYFEEGAKQNYEFNKLYKLRDYPIESCLPLFDEEYHLPVDRFIGDINIDFTYNGNSVIEIENLRSVNSKGFVRPTLISKVWGYESKSYVYEDTKEYIIWEKLKFPGLNLSFEVLLRLFWNYADTIYKDIDVYCNRDIISLDVIEERHRNVATKKLIDKVNEIIIYPANNKSTANNLMLLRLHEYKLLNLYHKDEEFRKVFIIETGESCFQYYLELLKKSLEIYYRDKYMANLK